MTQVDYRAHIASIAPAWLPTFDRMLRNGLTPARAYAAIAGQTRERVVAVAAAIKGMLRPGSRSDAWIYNAARMVLAAALESGIPLPMLMATGYWESRFSCSAVGVPVRMRDGSTARAVGPGQILEPYSGPYTDAAWRGPAALNRDPRFNLTVADVQNAARCAELWRMAARYQERMWSISQGPDEGYRKVIGWYSAGSNWRGADAQDYVRKHYQKALEAQQLLLRAGFR